MLVRVFKAAYTEIDDATAYFDEQREGLGERFKVDLQRTIDFILEHPHSGKRLSDRVRKFRLSTFRYDVIYILDVAEIVIVAVAHHRKRPGYWHNRLGGLGRR
jgi:plasmid stabilization system protein ParE